MNSNEEVETELDIPYGYCHCGCGGLTKINKYNDARKSTKKGEPYLFIKGHNPSIKKETCKRGHARIPENLDTKGSCKLCKRITETKELKHKWYKTSYAKNKESVKLKSLSYFTKNKDTILPKRRLYSKEYRINNPDLIKMQAKQQTFVKVKEVKNSYVASILKLPVSQIPLDMLEAKRLHIQINRKLKELK